MAFVAIDGGGGAGKSTLAQAVAAERNDVRVLHLDDFFHSTDPGPASVDLRRLRRDALAPLRRGEAARFQRFEWWGEYLAEWHVVEPGRIVVVEGVFALQPALRPVYDLAVWVDTDAEVRLARGLERDGVDQAGTWRAWMAAEDAYAAELRPFDVVDLVVGEPCRPTVSRAEQ